MLQSNPLRHLKAETFNDLANIEELNFENCWLETIEPATFQVSSKFDFGFSYFLTNCAKRGWVMGGGTGFDLIISKRRMKISSS